MQEEDYEQAQPAYPVAGAAQANRSYEERCFVFHYALQVTSMVALSTTSLALMMVDGLMVKTLPVA